MFWRKAGNLDQVLGLAVVNRGSESMKRRASYSSWSPSLLAAGAAALMLMQPQKASADDVSPSGKGIVGGALLGGEVVVIGEAIAGVKPGWAYLVGGALGAGAGAFAGWEAEQNADPKVSVYLLAGGMALLIPATVAALQATSYQPPADYSEDRPSGGAPISEPPRPNSTPPAGISPGPSSAPPAGNPATPSGPSSMHLRWQAPKLLLPTGLLAVDEGSLRVAMPAVEIRPVYRIDELQKYHLAQQQELRVPVLSATF
jgi:hypothetical protein